MIPRTVTPLSSVLKLQLEPDGADAVGVLELEVPVHEHAGIGDEGRRPLLVELESFELVAAQPAPVQAASSAPLGGLPAAGASVVLGEEELECPVDERALQGSR